MSRTERMPRPLPYRPATNAALAVITLLLACTGCAGVPAEQADSGAMRMALIDFNSCAKPVYPSADLQANHQGTVTLRFLVTQDGKVNDSQVARTSGYASLDEAARTAIATCRFQPALVHGKPVETWAPIQYVWTTS